MSPTARRVASSGHEPATPTTLWNQPSRYQSFSNRTLSPSTTPIQLTVRLSPSAGFASWPATTMALSTGKRLNAPSSFAIATNGDSAGFDGGAEALALAPALALGCAVETGSATEAEAVAVASGPLGPVEPEPEHAMRSPSGARRARLTQWRMVPHANQERTLWNRKRAPRPNARRGLLLTRVSSSPTQAAWQAPCPRRERARPRADDASRCASSTPSRGWCRSACSW